MNLPAIPILKCCTWEHQQDTYSSCFLSVSCVLQVTCEHLKPALQGRHWGSRFHDLTSASLLGSRRNWTQIFQKVSDVQIPLIIKESPELLIKNTPFKPGDLEWGWETGSLKSSKWFLFSLRLGKPIAKYKRASNYPQRIENRNSISWESYRFHDMSVSSSLFLRDPE